MQYLIEGTNGAQPMGCTKCNQCICLAGCKSQPCSFSNCGTRDNCGCRSNFCGGQICAPAKAIPVTKLSKGI